MDRGYKTGAHPCWILGNFNWTPGVSQERTQDSRGRGSSRVRSLEQLLDPWHESSSVFQQLVWSCLKVPAECQAHLGGVS